MGERVLPAVLPPCLACMLSLPPEAPMTATAALAVFPVENALAPAPSMEAVGEAKRDNMMMRVEVERGDTDEVTRTRAAGGHGDTGAKNKLHEKRKKAFSFTTD